MRRVLLQIGLVAALATGGFAARAQDRAWIQVEAQPSLAEAEARARNWTTALGVEPGEVQGFRLNSGWYAIVIGPFAPAEAAAQLSSLRNQRAIPGDSYITDGRPFRETFWPEAGTAAEAVAAPQPLVVDPQTGVVTDPNAQAAEVVVPEPAPEPVAEAPAPEPVPQVQPTPEVQAAAEPAPQPEPDESAEDARRSEAALSEGDRKELQSALQWYGFYNSTIDGAFGRGTRASMAAWQEARGYDPTGVLTSRQRAEITGGHQADQREFGFETVTEAESGIELALPMAMVGFDHYEPPFVHFSERNGSGMRVILISTPGDEATLAGLYDTLQTLSIIPEGGARSRNGGKFTIDGASPALRSWAQAEVARGMVKGFIISAPADKAAQFDRILPIMQASFRPVGDRALDPGLAPMDDSARAGLMSGLEVRRPKLSRSGFFVDDKGTVLTTAEAVEQCGRITIDRLTGAKVVLADRGAGLAVLAPETAMAPRAFATFQTATDRPGSEIAVSGFSYEDRLPAPVLTFGTLAEATGLNGETGLKRLSVPVLAGDAGGPVLDGTGAVIGMLLSRGAGARVLPEGVSFAAAVPGLTAKLAGAGITPASAAVEAPATPDALAHAASAMTVLVSCWE